MPIVSTASMASRTLPGPRRVRRAENAGEEKDIVYQRASAAFRRLRKREVLRWFPSSSGAMAVLRPSPARSAPEIEFGLLRCLGSSVCRPDISATPPRVLSIAAGSSEIIELHQRIGPVDGLGHTRLLEEVHLAQFMNKRNHLPNSVLQGRWSLLRRISILFRHWGNRPSNKTAPLESVVDFTGPLEGDDDDRRLFRLEETDLRDGYLII